MFPSNTWSIGTPSGNAESSSSEQSSGKGMGMLQWQAILNGFSSTLVMQ